MPFGVFNRDVIYDTNKDDNLSEGQAKTFILCGSAKDITPTPKKTVVTTSKTKVKKYESKEDN
jgi:hypothetical protein